MGTFISYLQNVLVPIGVFFLILKPQVSKHKRYKLRLQSSKATSGALFLEFGFPLPTHTESHPSGIIEFM